MRGLTHCDAVAAACAIRGLSADRQRWAVDAFIARAHAADLYRKRLGRVHPLWGNGTLGAAVPAARRAGREPRLSDDLYLEALVAVMDRVLAWRRRTCS